MVQTYYSYYVIFNVLVFQNALNHGGKIDASAMQKYLEHEMASYNSELKRLIKDRDNAKEARELSSYDVSRAKELYRRLVKLLHPDLNPETDKRADLKEIWQRIQIAHLSNNLKELSELEVLARKVLKDLNLSNVKVDIPDIEDRIRELKEEIDTIQKSEPYTFKYLVEDEEAIEKKTKELTTDTKNYKKYQSELAQVISSMMAGGGLQIYV